MTGTIIQRNKQILAGVVALLLFTACNRNVVYSEYRAFKDLAWHASDSVVFEVEVTDTETLNNISLMIRHADQYPFNNLFLFVTTSYPDSRVLTDTMEIVLANNKGEWKGSGSGDIFDFKVPVKKNVRLPMPGKYRFSFVQGMRADPLPMIMDFGLEIVKSK